MTSKAPCHDCGQPMVLSRRGAKQQRYCTACRLGRSAAWNDGRTSTCACGREYIAWTGPKNQRMCGFCVLTFTNGRGMRDAAEGTCTYHGDTKMPCHSDSLPGPTVQVDEKVRLCYPCLHDPARFEDNRGALVRKHGQLTKQNPSATVGSRKGTE